MSIEVGTTVEGKVTGITNFGAFVELPGGETGLVHISEVANTYVKDITNYLKEDETVKVKVINIDDDGKIGLSIKQLKDPADRKDHAPKRSFDEKMEDFLKQSSDRQQDLRNRESKRRGQNGN
ncbi:S1 RNA-binding domain-containing protein [Halanaerobiaceae bacterium Z-7014]|uniref:S1 RNA-binding domain-containing protein n=1 Tax=Halonatronomonas betaini TaxID=2778430 RepID=A0A931AWP5_9FIRM|nr:S1 RNA-binding domain-containing protein [Halonatronomonas betaini]MBF8438195.1 S1 RNA-binding domain-containing protein [Halonatronomonas betaini]